MPLLPTLVLALLLPAIGAAPRPTTPCCTATIRITVPANTGTVYLTGGLPELGPWRVDAVAMHGEGPERSAEVTAVPGTSFEYKFTLGAWNREALGYAGAPLPPFRLTLEHDTVVTHDIPDFKKDPRAYMADWEGSGVQGRLVYWSDVHSAFLGPTRNVEIWLPPGYDDHPGRRYPVLYMHDGQNLFDPRLALGGVDWGVDEAIGRLVARGVIPPIIVVGVWNSADRWGEYSPWHNAPNYARFLIEELMPRVNAAFRTETGPAHTAVMGSSMGGLLSYYLTTYHPDVFGGCGCLSSHFVLSEAYVAQVMPGAVTTSTPDTTPYIVRDIRAGLRAPAGVRYWFDYGTVGLDSAYGPVHESIRSWLRQQGRTEGKDFVVRRYDGANHNENSWRARLEDPLTFLFGRGQAAAAPALAVPAWSKDAIWYQIFVERFRNGDPGNDPTAHDIEGFTDTPAPAGWRPTPWGWDWYREEPWARATGRDFYRTVQYRRYGGDLQGVLDRLDYLQRLGVTALFLNPINDAPSLHKYDARNYHHIDRNFGPDPRGDEARIAKEDPADPTTWVWTSADSLFLTLVREVHRRGMRIIMDYSWNHTGIRFWAWQDILKNQRASKYADWYEVERFDDPSTPDTNEFSYRGWAGVPWLPEWKKVGRPVGMTHGAIEGNLVPAVRDHIFSVTRRWLDPNGDGDPSDGVDGFRLDVADVVPLGFWRDYRRFVRGVNPEAYLVGEIWWEQWPDRLYDPAPWVQGDVFDAVMHYQWFTPARSFFAGAPPHRNASAFIAGLDSLGLGISAEHQEAMMNLTASHDTPRFSTSIYNRGIYKFHATPREDSTYRINRPDAATRRTEELILVHQFTYVGAPHIWNGDEVGMWGADDPDERKPLVWSDLRYDDETTHPFGRTRPRDRVVPDTALFRVYQEMIALRKDHLRLFVDGEFRWLEHDDARGTVAYERTRDGERAIVLFNTSTAAQVITLPRTGRYQRAWPAGGGALVARGSLRVTLPPRSARVFIGK